MRALGIITMELMQKYTQDNGTVGVENLDRWPSDSDAVTFLSETTSAASARELSKVSSPFRPRIAANTTSMHYCDMVARKRFLRGWFL